jgi:hypothetical protein
MGENRIESMKRMPSKIKILLRTSKQELSLCFQYFNDFRLFIYIKRKRPRIGNCCTSQKKRMKIFII